MSSQVGRPQSSRLPTVKSVSGLGSLLPLRQKSREHLLPPVDRTKILVSITLKDNFLRKIMAHVKSWSVNCEPSAFNEKPVEFIDLSILLYIVVC